MTLQEIREKDAISPTELKRFGKRVVLFCADEEWRKIYNPKAENADVDNAWSKAMRITADKVTVCLAHNKGAQLYTGHHKENDWSRTFWWQKGWHYVNRTGEFAVVKAA